MIYTVKKEGKLFDLLMIEANSEEEAIKTALGVKYPYSDDTQLWDVSVTRCMENWDDAIVG